MNLLRHLLVFCTLLLPAAGQAPLPESFSRQAEALKLTHQATTPLTRDLIQSMFSAGEMARIMDWMKQAQAPGLHHFKDAQGKDITLHHFRFEPALDRESIRELASIESLTLERGLERLKMAGFFIEAPDFEAPKEAKGAYRDHFTYQLSRSGDDTPLEIRRCRDYSATHFFIINAVDSQITLDQLKGLLDSLSDGTPDQP